jgi:acetylglutamate kinase
MAKPNCLIKVSGTLLRNPRVFERIREETRDYYVVILTGGGKGINDKFMELGLPIEFCVVGRVCRTRRQKEEAEKVLKQNRDDIQDMLNDMGIAARVEIPMRDHGPVTCPENGDVAILDLYLGYEKILMFTTADKVEAKQQWLKEVAHCFRHIAVGELDKIEVVGF